MTEKNEITRDKGEQDIVTNTWEIAEEVLLNYHFI